MDRSPATPITIIFKYAAAAPVDNRAAFDIMKKCRVCHIEKPFQEFSRNKLNKDGRLNICKVCDREKKKEWYRENLLREREKRKKWQDENPELHLRHQRAYHKRKRINQSQ